jgi:hypothetical protein
MSVASPYCNWVGAPPSIEQDRAGPSRLAMCAKTPSLRLPRVSSGVVLSKWVPTRVGHLLPMVGLRDVCGELAMGVPKHNTCRGRRLSIIGWEKERLSTKSNGPLPQTESYMRSDTNICTHRFWLHAYGLLTIQQLLCLLRICTASLFSLY